MRSLINLTLFTLLVASFASAADVSGKWSGSLEIKTPDGQTQTLPGYAELKQQGTTLTGTVWKDVENKFPIKKGRVEGDKITFEFSAPEGEEEATLVHMVRLTAVSKNQLEGELRFGQEGETVAGKLTFTRDK